jgi:hypothetical protein
MKANELRIGNYVQSGRGIYTIGYISTDGIEAVLSEDKTLIINNSIIFKPIPLTEQWLKDFGFRKVGYNEEENDVFTIKDDEVWILWNGHKFILDQYENEIKYVHQLQNLYFALTGEELKKTKTSKDAKA